MIVLIILFCAQVTAYEELFHLKKIEDVRAYEVAAAENDFMLESCRLEKLRNGFKWPCYLLPGSQVTSIDMINECKEKLEHITSTAQLPTGGQLSKLPKECQKLIEKRRQVLAYKANGI